MAPFPFRTNAPYHFSTELAGDPVDASAQVIGMFLDGDEFVNRSEPTCRSV